VSTPTPRCPACGGGDCREILAAPGVPALCNALAADRAAALAAPRGDLRLASCADCGHLFNHAFAPDLAVYDADYENPLHHSAVFRDYVEVLARDLARRHDLAGRLVFEIACGQGDFLRRLCAVAGARGAGCDPGFRDGGGGDGPAIAPQAFAPGLLPPETALVCCRHALEHAADPLAFLRDVRAALGPDARTPGYWEVPDVRWTLRDGGVWDLIYEHPSYFGPASLARVLMRAGFAVEAVAAGYGGQFLAAHVRAAAPGRAAGAAFAAEAAEARRLAAALGSTVESARRLWRARLAAHAAAGRRVAVWGAGSKGVSFLNLTGAGDAVVCVVDINPLKRGRYVPGTGHPVVAPGDLPELRPGLVVVMNPLYVDEVRRTLAGLGVAAAVVVASPTPGEEPW